jgi:hypothetical protein
MASDKGERINLVGKIVIAGVATWQSLKINYSILSLTRFAGFKSL